MPKPNKRLFEPGQAIELAVDIANHMRQQQTNELDAVNATIGVLLEAAAWVIVRASPSPEAAIETTLGFIERFQTQVSFLNSELEDAGGGLPAPVEPHYAAEPAITNEYLEKVCLGLAPVLDRSLNADFYERKIGFLLSIFAFGERGAPLAFSSNAEKDGVKNALAELLVRIDETARVATVRS